MSDFLWTDLTETLLYGAILPAMFFFTLFLLIGVLP